MNQESLLLWRALALTTVKLLAQRERAFSTDDIWPLLADLPKPDDPRALGPVLTSAAAEMIIRKTPLVVASRRPECHARPIAIWTSVPLAGTFNDAAAYVAANTKSVIAPPIFAPPTEPDTENTLFTYQPGR